jgi:DNA-binding MarR family transcriptional regulator
MAVSEEASAVLTVDRVIHEPARLVLLSILYAVESADFVYLANETGLTKGNLSSHLTRLEQAGYIQVEKTYKGKVPLTICQITPAGKAAFEAYRKAFGRFLETLEP